MRSINQPWELAGGGVESVSVCFGDIGQATCDSQKLQVTWELCHVSYDIFVFLSMKNVLDKLYLYLYLFLYKIIASLQF